MMSWLLLTLQIVLSLALFVAFQSKVLHPAEFIGALRLSHFSSAMVITIATAVPPIEIALSLGLLIVTPPGLPVVFVATAIILIVFTFWMAWVRRRGFHIRCGCFGMGSAEVGTRSMRRNVLLIAMAAGGTVISTRAPGVIPNHSLPVVIVVTAALLIVALAVEFRRAWPSMTLTFRQIESNDSKS